MQIFFSNFFKIFCKFLQIFANFFKIFAKFWPIFGAKNRQKSTKKSILTVGHARLKMVEFPSNLTILLLYSIESQSAVYTRVSDFLWILWIPDWRGKRPFDPSGMEIGHFGAMVITFLEVRSEKSIFLVQNRRLSANFRSKFALSRQFRPTFAKVGLNCRLSANSRFWPNREFALSRRFWSKVTAKAATSHAFKKRRFLAKFARAAQSLAKSTRSIWSNFVSLWQIFKKSGSAFFVGCRGPVASG